MKKGLLLCAVCALGMAIPSHAQITTTLPKKCEAFRPDVLYSAMLTDTDVRKLSQSRDFGQRSSARGENGKEYWIVYSDRDDNVAYAAPNSQKEVSRLHFNEKVRIAQIQDGYALVYSEPKEQETYPKLSSEITWKGWVPMKHLLLWNVCPVNESGIYFKAMLCANIDESLSNNRLGLLFKNPENTDKSTPMSVDFTYYFVMKEVGDLVLLSRQNTMNGITDQVLYGWVDRNSFVAWNQRSCLEPTWEIEDVEFFSQRGVIANIYDKKSMKDKASWITFEKKKSSAAYDPYMYRMDGNQLRYPILDDNTKDVWNCSTFSSPGGKTAINATTDAQKKASQLPKQLMENLSKINIAFVIDGTRSMEPFFPAVRDVIKEISAYLSSSMKLKVGALIYRDKADGQYVTEIVPMTSPDNQKLADWLNKGGTYGIKSGGGDKTMEEALYYGINSALDSFGFNPEESNIMFVIGDCGDAGDYPDINEKTIVDKLVAKNVCIMGFQVRNSSDPSFPMFNDNMCDLIQESLQAKFSKLDSQVKVTSKLKKSEYEFSNNAKSIEGDLYVGSHKYVQSGVLSVDDLKSQIISSVIKIKTTVDHQLELTNDLANGVFSASNYFQGNTEITGPQLDQKWLEQRVGKEQMALLKQSNTTVSFKGYTPRKDVESDRDFYKTVIFISQQEMNTLMIRLTPLYEVAQRKGNEREPYIKALKALVQGMIPNISDSEINGMSYDRIMGMVAGLNTSTMTLGGRTLSEIASNQAVNATEYQSIIKKFQRQYQKLQRIQKQPYKFVREFNGAKYYWIPTEDLP